MDDNLRSIDRVRLLMITFFFCFCVMQPIGVTIVRVRAKPAWVLPLRRYSIYKQRIYMSNS